MAVVHAFGSINQDVVIRLGRRPKPGETVFGQSLDLLPGGKGANQAVAAQRYLSGKDAQTVFYGCVGDDAFGAALTQYLEQEGLDCKIEQISSCSTGTAIIDVDMLGENSIVVIPGANAENEKYLPFLKYSKPNTGDILLLQNEIPVSANLAAAQKASNHGTKIVYNAAPYLEESCEIAKLVDYLVLNESEANSLYNSTLASDASHQEWLNLAQNIRAQFSCIVIITLGSRGLVCSGKQDIIQDTRQVKVVDTTGAGDCFCGTFAAALVETQSLASALNVGCVAASISVEHLGASSSFPSREQIDSTMDFRQ